MSIVLSPNRDKELGLNQEKLSARIKANKKLSEKVHQLSTYIAEGQGLAYGLNFPSGGVLAGFLADAITFSIAALQEDGQLPKRLPKTTNKADEKGHGTYL